MDWKDPEKELPPYGIPVLIWIGCEKCRKKEPHAHKAVATDWNFPESFQRGTYCKGRPESDKKYMQSWTEKEFLPYWSPCKAYRWAYVIPPEGCE